MNISFTNFIFLLIFLIYSRLGIAQNLPVPVFLAVSYNVQGQQIDLSWKSANTDKIDGFIIYRTVFNFQGIADSAFMPVAEINNSYASNWNTRFENGTFGQANLDSAQYIFKIASFKNANGIKEYSELSKAASPPFLFQAQLVDCKQKILFRWKKALNHDFSSSFIILSANNYLDTIRIENDSNSFLFNVRSLALTTQLNVRYQEQYKDTLVLNSNIQQLNLFKNTKVDLYIDSLIDTKNKSTLYFRLEDDKQQISQLIIQKNGAIYDSLPISENQYILPTSDKSALYSLKAVNSCNQTLARTANFKIFTLMNKTIDTQKYFEFSPRFYYSNPTNIQKFSVYEFRNSSWQILQEFTYLPNSVVDNISTSLSEKTYRSAVKFRDLSTNSDVYFRSEKLRISKKAVLKIPNAVFLNAPNEMDRYFSVLAKYISDFNIVIYDNNGKILYQSQDISFKWQPNYLNKGIKRQMYFFRIDYISANSQKIRKEGSFFVFF